MSVFLLFTSQDLTARQQTTRDLLEVLIGRIGKLKVYNGTSQYSIHHNTHYSLNVQIKTDPMMYMPK